ncbi:MAG: gluconate 2-dehydrogenase subunit 3 family protein [Candidatus Eremiobacteraeota bacterium]|nr:gluconate 2-dehydrogenase subunit 3 family protein [Candidatus Eremiobacteraeota bacterium]
MNERDGDDPRPVDPRTGLPLHRREQPGYYPGFSTLAQQNYWDAKTRAVILDRVHNVPESHFFDAAQTRVLEAICARLIPQDDRDDAHRIPIVPHIDRRLADGDGDGYRYDDMPPDPEAYLLGLRAIDESSPIAFECGFLRASLSQQDKLLRSLHDGKPLVEHSAWKRMPVKRFWMLLLSDCVEAYYSHPYAWDEIGFGGPAYPRAYMRLENGEPETWEVDEVRYPWAAPPWSASAEASPPGEDEHYGSSGQGGSH